VTWLVVDFGTTSTKSALVDLDTGHFRHLRRHDALAPVDGPAGRHEVPLTAISQRFATICADAWEAGPFDGIVLCSEMHGFALLDPTTGTPLSDYVSWLDARAHEPIDGRATFDLVVERLGSDAFRRITGMRPRPGFPLMNLLHWSRERAGAAGLPERVQVVSLPGWLARSADAPMPAEHPTMLAAMALYDVAGGETSAELLALVRSLGGPALDVGPVADDTTLAGYWTSPDGAVPIHAGVGDHQASVLGAGAAPDVASVNLGTGSQVSLVDGPLRDDVEHRPFFDGRHLAAVTHIPAGRALNVFVGFLQQAAAYGRPPGDTSPDVWRDLALLTPEEIAAAPLTVDLAVFDGARGWSGGGSVTGITEGALAPRTWLASVLRAFSAQYGAVLADLDPQQSAGRVALGGGIARRLPHLPAAVAAACGRPVDAATDLDESLLGLRALALRCAGRATSVAEAQQRFGRQSTVEEES
jgi:sugar (pentulose or hexulose) kinase